MSTSWRPLRHVPRRALGGACGWGVLLTLAGVGAWQFAAALREGAATGHDFVQDYASMRALASGRDPYEPYNAVTLELFGGPPHKGNLYSFHTPSSLPFFLWMIPLSYGPAFATWGVVSLAALWIVCWLPLRTYPIRHPGLFGGLLALGLVSAPALRDNFVEGQLNVVVMAGLVAMWWAQRAQRSGLAGCLLGAAFALKPIPGLFFAYYVWRRQWRLLLFAAVTLAIFNAVGLMLAGLDGAWLYFTVNYPDHAELWPGYPDNASVRGLLTRLFGPIAPNTWRRPLYPLPGATLALWLASGALLAGVFWLAARRPRPLSSCPDLEHASVWALTLLVTPIVWPHYYVVLVPAILLILPTLAAGMMKRPYPRVVAGIVMVAALSLLAPSHYVEPWRGDGGSQLLALLVMFGVCLASLRWARTDQRDGNSRLASM